MDAVKFLKEFGRMCNKHDRCANCPMWGDDTTEDYMWCCDGARMESDE